MQKLNFTTVPNVILDNMSELTGAQVKVLMAIARKTIGWHKDTDWISNKVMMSMTGLTRQGLYKAVDGLIEKDLIQKVITGDKGNEKVCYDLNFEEDRNSVASPSATELQGDRNSVAPQKKLLKETIQKKKELPKAHTPLMKIEKEYFELFKNEFGEEADYNFGGGRKLINRYLKTHTEEKIIDLLQIWFYTGVGAWHGYSFMNLQKDWNRLLIIYNSLQMHMLTKEIYTVWAGNISELNERDNKHFEVPGYDGWRKREIQRRYQELTVPA